MELGDREVIRVDHNDSESILLAEKRKFELEELGYTLQYTMTSLNISRLIYKKDLDNN